ncbi:MAG: hypothetical protein V1754_02755 [Pseudomonadota bacterium]
MREIGLALVFVLIVPFVGCSGGDSDKDAALLDSTPPATDTKVESTPHDMGDAEAKEDMVRELGPALEMGTDGPRVDAPVTPPGCKAAGGTCTEARWVICGVGLEPVDPDPHRDCGSGSSIAGWCCVPAPTSTCSSDPGGNCVVGTACTGCWGTVAGLTCEAGRVCCSDICD